MHHDHERAKVRVRSTVGGTRIVNKMTAVINIRDRCRTGFVCPETVATLAIPVKVPIWPNHQCDKMSFFRTLVIRRWTVDKAVGLKCRLCQGNGLAGNFKRTFRKRLISFSTKPGDLCPIGKRRIGPVLPQIKSSKYGSVARCDRPTPKRLPLTN